MPLLWVIVITQSRKQSVDVNTETEIVNLWKEFGYVILAALKNSNFHTWWQQTPFLQSWTQEFGFYFWQTQISYQIV